MGDPFFRISPSENPNKILKVRQPAVYVCVSVCVCVCVCASSLNLEPFSYNKHLFCILYLGGIGGLAWTRFLLYICYFVILAGRFGWCDFADVLIFLACYFLFLNIFSKRERESFSYREGGGDLTDKPVRLPVDLPAFSVYFTAVQ